MANAAPLAPTLTSPPNNGYIIYSQSNVFSWTFNDPGDTQSTVDFRYKKAGDATWTTMAWGPLTAESLTLPYPQPAGAWTQPAQYEWQIKTYDSLNQGAAWSASRFVNTIAEVPPATVTAPAAGATITSSPVTVTWTLPGGFTQDAYQVVLSDELDLVPYYYSGIVPSTVQSVTVPVKSGQGVAIKVNVHFRYNGEWSSLNAVHLTNAILPPETPLVVLAQVPDRPEVLVTVTNPAPSDGSHLAAVTWDLARDGVRIVKDRPLSATTYTDRMPGAGVVEYLVTAVTANGGTATSF